MSTLEVWKRSLAEAHHVLTQVLESPQLMEQCQKFSEVLTTAFRQQNRVFACGNGGSHCDAMHFAEELTGRYRKDRRPLGALALGDASHVTCVANDYGYDFIFSRQVEALARPGDVLLALSTSGNSTNVIRAVEAAQQKGMATVGLLGKDGGKLKAMVDIPIVVPAQTADRIQEVHIKLIHTVIETVEREIFPENY